MSTPGTSGADTGKTWIAVTVTALPDTPEQAARAAEVLARTITGLAFDGISVNLSINQYDEDEDDGDDD